MSNQDFYIMTMSPPEQYSNSKIKITEITDEIKTLNENKNSIIVFNDIIGSSNSRDLDQFSMRGRHKKIKIFIIYHNPILIYRKE